MPVIGKKTDNYQLGTQRRVILEEEKKSNQRIRNLKRSLGKEQETRKNIKRRKTKNAILTKKVREVKEIADSLPSVLAQQRRVFIEVVSKADASPLETFEEFQENWEKEKQRKVLLAKEQEEQEKTNELEQTEKQEEQEKTTELEQTEEQEEQEKTNELEQTEEQTEEQEETNKSEQKENKPKRKVKIRRKVVLFSEQVEKEQQAEEERNEKEQNGEEQMETEQIETEQKETEQEETEQSSELEQNKTEQNNEEPDLLELKIGEDEYETLDLEEELGIDRALSSQPTQNKSSRSPRKENNTASGTTAPIAPFTGGRGSTATKRQFVPNNGRLENSSSKIRTKYVPAASRYIRWTPTHRR